MAAANGLGFLIRPRHVSRLRPVAFTESDGPAMEKGFLQGVEWVVKLPVYAVIVVIVASMIFGAVDLLVIFGKALMSPDPVPFVISVSELMVIFSLGIIIVIGYELIKSVILILKSNVIPVDSIAKIAAIAVLNKIITADYATMDAYKIAATALVLLAIGAAYYCFHAKS